MSDTASPQTHAPRHRRAPRIPAVLADVAIRGTILIVFVFAPMVAGLARLAQR